jgi:hypothetical protein
MVGKGDILQIFSHNGLTYFAEVTYVKDDKHPNSKVEFNYLNREDRSMGYIRVSKLKRNLENGTVTILGDYKFIKKPNLKFKFT